MCLRNVEPALSTPAFGPELMVYRQFETSCEAWSTTASGSSGCIYNLSKAKIKNTYLMWLLPHSEFDFCAASGKHLTRLVVALFLRKGWSWSSATAKAAACRGLSFLRRLGCYRAPVCLGLWSKASVAMDELQATSLMIWNSKLYT